MVSPNKRSAPRKEVRGLHVTSLMTLNPLKKIAKSGHIIDASYTGILLQVDRKSLIPDQLRSNLTLESIIDEEVMFKIEEMDLEIDGTVTRTKMVGKGVFEIAVDYSQQAPEYWRECLIDLLPGKELK